MDVWVDKLYFILIFLEKINKIEFLSFVIFFFYVVNYNWFENFVFKYILKFNKIELKGGGLCFWSLCYFKIKKYMNFDKLSNIFRI